MDPITPAWSIVIVGMGRPRLREQLTMILTMNLSILEKKTQLAENPHVDKSHFQSKSIGLAMGIT